MARPPRWVREFASSADLDAVTAAVRQAELATSGEIRVHLVARCPADPMARAIQVFEHLGMHRTALRNGVLIYLAVEDRKLAIIGDAGVHERVAPDYWEALTKGLITHLGAGRPREGLVAAVREVGETLRRYFPRAPNDQNELSDDVSIG